MIDTVVAEGFPLNRLDDLLPYLGLPEGAFVEPIPASTAPTPAANASRRLRRLHGQMGASCFTTEMGIERPLDYRCQRDRNRGAGG